MKRLLAYLFIVLGLGLTFSVNAEAANFSDKLKVIICAEPRWDQDKKEKKLMNIFVLNDTGRLCENIYGGWVNINYRKYLDIKDNPYQHDYEFGTLLTKLYNKICINKKGIVHNLNSNCNPNSEKEVVIIGGDEKYIYINQNKSTGTLIAKAEPSKTQKVAISNKDYYCLVATDKYFSSFYYFHINNFPNFQKKVSNFSKFRKIDSNNENEIKNLCDKEIFRDKNPFKYKVVNLHYEGTDFTKILSSMSLNNDNQGTGSPGYYGEGQNYLLNYYFVKNILNAPKGILSKVNSYNAKTQIAKAKPSQTQPVKEFTKIVGEGIGSDYINTYELTSGGKPTKKTKWSLKFAEEQACLEAQKNTYKNAFTKSGVPTNNNINRFLIAAIVNETVLRKDIDIDINDKNLKCDYSAELLVKTSELNKFATKFKKKVKVAKVEEPKQEEFKPKKTNQDNEAPVITIAEAITVDSQAYTLKGKVKDKSQVYLTIDGRQVDVKKGKFELDRFNIDPDVAENIKIVAIDKWNNRTEKTIKVTIDLQSTNIAKVYEQLKPNNIKVKTDKNKIAIIIGIEKYENLTNLDAKYANRDAKAFRTYATRALGIKPSNIKVLIDDKANRGNTLEAFKIWLPKIAGKGGKDIHIFFAGHGLASENGKDLYILPQDGNAKLLDDTAITRLELISLIQKVNPKSVTMFFDTCYSGQTRDERMLVASLLRPIQIISEEQDTPDNFTIFSASNYDQVSGGIEEAQHGMFSYYLMKGLEGNADENKDKKITNGELIAYLKDNVSEEAFTQNREQDPMLVGDSNKVLMSYR
ncbi:caspase family protein [Candidatus Pelagibacter sp.]|nr:caspase family protein [Candidatus Pelagibacter sp.]